MWNFTKNTMASVLGTIIGIFLLFFIIFAAALGSSGDDKFSLKENSILTLRLNGAIVERVSDKAQDIQIDFLPMANQSALGLKQILGAINRAKEDVNIKGIFLNIDAVSAMPSTAFDIHEALVDFKESGKWIVAYAEGFTQASYYLSSVADELYLYPEGGLNWQGLGGRSMYFKNMLDNLDIEMQIIRGPNNKYKSAVEPIMYDHMSEPSRLQSEELLGDIWRIMLEGIASQRNITVAELNRLATSVSIRSAHDAKTYGLVDDLKYQDEVMAILKEKIGVEDDFSITEKKEHLISLGNYNRASEDDNASYKSDRVAVVYAVGGIQSGKGNDETIGSETTAAALKKARLDDKVKAIVLRVNSGGGSALASDVIWRETELIKASGKPFVASMGDVAASGGYYIVCGADKIFANKNTITGSIGVFGVLPNLENFYENKLGIKTDGVNTNGHNAWSLNYPLDSLQKIAVEESVTEIYDVFTSKVAEGRGISQSEVDAVGQGRVWTGEDAKEVGLVDEIGDLHDAIEAAASLASLDEYRVKDFPKMEDPMEKLLKEMTGQAAIENYLGTEIKEILKIKEVLEMKGVQARMPFILEIE